jgi:hypothetical protein
MNPGTGFRQYEMAIFGGVATPADDVPERPTRDQSAFGLTVPDEAEMICQRNKGGAGHSGSMLPARETASACKRMRALQGC